MNYVVADPEMLASTAANVEQIGSAISTATANAAGPTTGLLAAAEDEVSLAITRLFSTYGQEYQALLGQAAAFHSEFAQALAAAGSAYVQSEAVNATSVGGSLPSALADLREPIQTLLGRVPTGGGVSGSGALTLLTSPSTVALIMGGTGNPGPDPQYITNVNQSYIQPLFPGASPQGLTTPEQDWPFHGNLTLNQSVAKGVQTLDAAINSQLPAHDVVVFGYSQSATVATNEINALMKLPLSQQPDPSRLSFVLVGDPNNPNGGVLERFRGFYLPFVDITFNGSTPPNSPYPTYIYSAQYDGIADAPQYPLNVVSDLNAVMGYFYVHPTYANLTPAQVAAAQQLATSPGYIGNTHYYMLLTQDLPLVQPIRDIPFAGPALADLIQPDLRVLVDMGYGNIGEYGDAGFGYDYANIPTPARLLEFPNPVNIGVDLLTGSVQGPVAALVDVGLLPTSYTPTAYPYVPSIDPGLNFELFQPSTTGVSLLSGAAGSVLHLIPPIN